VFGADHDVAVLTELLRRLVGGAILAVAADLPDDL
jgi:hypothetical protein